MEKTLSPQNAATINKVMAEAKPPTQTERPPRKEFRKRPDVKINKPFEALAGFKVK